MSVRKKIDSRIKTLIENGVNANMRSLMMIIGDNGYYNIRVSTSKHKKILWCYHQNLVYNGTTGQPKKSRKKRSKKAPSAIATGSGDNVDQLFQLFLQSYDIRYCYYSDVDKVLGHTYDAVVLQDYSQLTPNIISKCIETVSGRGLVMMLISTIQSLSQIYTLQMSVHTRLRSSARTQIVPRFNERFILSLATCSAALMVDDELNVLPTSTYSQKLTKIVVDPQVALQQANQLSQLHDDLSSTAVIGPLVKQTTTIDQARATLLFLEALSQKSLRTTIALTAARGRGKSASLGLAIAGAVGIGYSNIFVTAPSVTNLHTLFTFVLRGLTELHLKEHIDYELVVSAEDHSSITRINIFHTHRQTIQYVSPDESHRVAQAELLVIDECAAIPLPWVRKLLGPYTVFMSSTVHGYEGTGRSLSLKLLAELRVNAGAGRTFKQVELQEPIRYATGDHIEAWLGRLLCFDCSPTPRPVLCPHPLRCNLYYVNKDALFSGHPTSESLLSEIMATFTSSHYKNSPNDLMLLSDAPAHHMFVLLPPIDPESTDLPPVLCAIHVALEGSINRSVVESALAQGKAAAGDMIPWILAQQFQDAALASMSGARIVRIAVHPECSGMGYGSQAARLLNDYYSEGTVTEIVEQPTSAAPVVGDDTLHSEVMQPRKLDQSLLCSLQERPAEALDWIGAAFGITEQLSRFWDRSGFLPVYTRLTSNPTTGEHTNIVIKSLDKAADWHSTLYADYRCRLLHLLSFDLGALSIDTVITLLRYNSETSAQQTTEPQPLDTLLSPHDVKRLIAYCSNQLDYHAILDMLPRVLVALLTGRLTSDRNVRVNQSQVRVLIGLILQRKSLEDLSVELSSPVPQLMALLGKAVRKLTKVITKLEVEAVELEELQEEQDAQDAQDEEKPYLPLADSEFALSTNEDAWQQALSKSGGGTPKNVTVATTKRPRADKSAKKKKKKKKKSRRAK